MIGFLGSYSNFIQSLDTSKLYEAQGPIANGCLHVQKLTFDVELVFFL
jgi:hypothetical protein